MNVLEELTEDRIDRAHVERRVEGWLEAIECLYADVTAWLQAGRLSHAIAARYPLDQIAAAHEAVENASVTGKVLVTP